jgi:hypothetical protein
MVYKFSRSFTFLCKWNIFPGKFNSNLESEYVFTNFTKASIFRYLVQIIKFIYSKCPQWKFWNPSQGSRLVLISISAFCEPHRIVISAWPFNRLIQLIWNDNLMSMKFYNLLQVRWAFHDKQSDLKW